MPTAGWVNAPRSPCMSYRVPQALRKRTVCRLALVHSEYHHARSRFSRAGLHVLATSPRVHLVDFTSPSRPSSPALESLMGRASPFGGAASGFSSHPRSAGFSATGRPFSPVGLGRFSGLRPVCWASGSSHNTMGLCCLLAPCTRSGPTFPPSLRSQAFLTSVRAGRTARQVAAPRCQRGVLD